MRKVPMDKELKKDRDKLYRKLARKKHGEVTSKSIDKVKNNISSQAGRKGATPDDILMAMCKKENIRYTVFSRHLRQKNTTAGSHIEQQKTTVINKVENRGNISNSSIMQGKTNASQARDSNWLLSYIIHPILRLLGLH